MINLVFICDPESYLREDNDIPMTYRAAARNSGIRLFHLPTHGVTGDDTVTVAPIPHGTLSHEDYLTLNERATCPMPVSAFDVMFCRTDKPFPPGYLNRLGKWLGRTRFLNNPLNKKTQIMPGYVNRIAPDFTPETAVADTAEALAAFLDRHGTV
ncbi:MAG: hypothetical protein MJE12_10570, partial [Alphaproteobacteria bacterium]|nr:hypothetical protein [Alphaproteobacteria bacterium]